MGRTHSRKLEEQTRIQGFSRKTWRNRPLAILWRRKEKNIIRVFKKQDAMGWSRFIRIIIGITRPALVNTVMEFQVPQNAGNFLSSG